MKWGYRCERIDLVPARDILAGGVTPRGHFSVIEAFLRPLRKLAQRATRI